MIFCNCFFQRACSQMEMSIYKICRLTCYTKIVQYLNLSGTVLSVLTSIFGIMFGAYKIWKKVITPYRKQSQFINENYSKEAKKSITRYYIQTRGQDIDPCDQEEIREDNGKFLSENLIQFFIKRAFKEDSFGKYYLVLADSGMGKTTFLLRLNRELLFHPIHKNKKKKVVVFIPLALSTCFDQIQKIQEPENTILLLDAMDENNNAILNYKQFFIKLVSNTERFYRIVLTCRTQFFPNRASEPETTGKIRIGSGKKSEEIVKKYLSPFNDEDVHKYLKKKYRFKKKKQNQAYGIVHKVPILMARPIILNWIDFLCVSPTSKTEFTFQIYEEIINQWIKRESLEQENKLLELSLAISNYMLENETTTMPATMVEEIAKRKEIKIRPIIAKSRSLLNRNGGGEFKFAHRSFLEYFIVYSIFDKLILPNNIQFWFGLSGVRRFFFEKLISSVNYIDDSSFGNVSRNVKTELRKFITDGSLLGILLESNTHYNAINNQHGFIIEIHVDPTADNWHSPLSDYLGTAVYVYSQNNEMVTENKQTKLGIKFTVKRIMDAQIQTDLEVYAIAAQLDLQDAPGIQLKWSFFNAK